IATNNLVDMVDDYFRSGWANDDWIIRARPILQREGIARAVQFTAPEGARNDEFYRFLARHELGNTCLIGWHAIPNEPLCLALHRRPDQPPYSDEEAIVLVAIRERLMQAARMAHQVSQNRVAGAIVGLDIAHMPAIFI